METSSGTEINLKLEITTARDILHGVELRAACPHYMSVLIVMCVYLVCVSHPEVRRMEAVLGRGAEGVSGDIVALCELGGDEDAGGHEAVGRDGQR